MMMNGRCWSLKLMARMTLKFFFSTNKCLINLLIANVVIVVCRECDDQHGHDIDDFQNIIFFRLFCFPYSIPRIISLIIFEIWFYPEKNWSNLISLLIFEPTWRVNVYLFLFQKIFHFIWSWNVNFLNIWNKQKKLPCL